MTETAIHLKPSGTLHDQSLDSLRQELEVLRSGCGKFDLGWRAQITAAGKDRVRWLHNMVTNNVRDLALNRGNYNFVLNAQGRILGDLCIFNRGEYLLLETDRIQVETLLTSLKRYIIMDKVELSECGEMRVATGICGPKAAETLAASGIAVEGMASLEVREVQIGDAAVTIIRGPEQKPNWYELWSDRDRAQAIRDRLTNAGAQPVGAEALELLRVLHGIPQYGQDIRDRDLPQETEQSQALNFTKGCYIGQEIVERIRSRGQVHRKFTGFEFDRLPALGKYDVEGRTLAEITSAVRVPVTAGERLIGLGYIRREAATPGTELDLGGIKARVVELPFEIQ
ncbi:MAG TPA: folate-binding protein [Candidatus Angelobacter sp.]